MTVHHLTSAFQIKNFGADGVFFGYASVFDNIDAHDDIVAQGAFRRS
jgi:phage head maturation protease